MRYELINGTLAGENLMYLFVYANSITYGWFGFCMLWSMFLVAFLGSLLSQLRFTSGINPSTSYLAASFVLFGWSLILSMYVGIINPLWVPVSIVMTIVGLIWVKVFNNNI